jgi:uncharacterized protein (TIGR02246 family)
MVGAPSQVVLGQQAEEVIMADEAAAIRSVVQEYANAVNAGDVSGFGATLADDVVFGVPDQRPLHGRAAVQKYLKEAWLDTTSSRRLRLAVNEIETVGDWAIAHGDFTVTVTWKTGMNQDMTGYFLNVFKRESDAAWRYKRSSFNFDQPIAAVQ